ncbi:MAG: hypothetical protein CMQ05_02300 [Gammaproteobacteria bacterium]|nr:hypothetical protein [Gammaproteobacteria bacterium]RPG26702.1 MAG: hypothetical protein CBC10_004055 [Gammaproteobacteria bacterium TMED50]
MALPRPAPKGPAFFSVLLMALLQACGGGGDTTPVSNTPPPDTGSTPALASLSFTEVSDASGLVRQWGYLGESTFDAEFMAGGVAATDYDQDGDVDVYVVGGDLDHNRLFQNQGDGSFVDVSVETGLNIRHKGTGPAFADVDGDGDLDLFIGAVSGDPYYLMENRGGVFFDVTSSSGIALNAPNTFSAAFADYDQDGDLDLALAHWGYVESADTETLWRNNGEGVFESVSTQSRVAATLIESADPDALQLMAPALRNDNSFTPNFADIDSDGDQDLLMASDFRTSQVFRNNEDSRFTKITDRSVIRDQAGMGGAVGDYDNDGDLDWFVTSIYKIGDDENDLIGFGNRLYNNDGSGIFTDVTDHAGVANGGWAWGTCFADFDNDGWLDIFHVNGWREESTEPINNYVSDQVRLFRATRDAQFIEGATDAGLTDTGQGRGIACFDADNDGDIDILITNSDDDQLVYYRNDSTLTDLYLTIRLEGRPVGARVTVTAGGNSQIRELRAGSNFLSQNPFELYFGMGTSETASITVRWPDGIESTMNGVSTNQTILIPRPEGENSQVRVLVDSGSGGGRFDPGDVVTISADSPQDPYFFSHWSATSGAFTDRFSPETTFTVPGAVTVVTANYLPGVGPTEDASIARQWNEVLLQAIRNDFARPTVHARNLFHLSAAMYDAWVSYADIEDPWLLGQTRAGETCSPAAQETPADIGSARHEAISFAAYRLLLHRFSQSPGQLATRRDAASLMSFHGYDTEFMSTDHENDGAAALGNHIAECYIRYGLSDGANEVNDYANTAYMTVNPALSPAEPGNPDIADHNRWQPLALDVAIDQAGQVVQSEPEFLSPEWGSVLPFALVDLDRTEFVRDAYTYSVFHDPGAPPSFDTADYLWHFMLVSVWGAHLTADDGVTWDISPASTGNLQLADYPTNLVDYAAFYNLTDGGDPGIGYTVNPATGAPYDSQFVPRGDYARVLAEFWADGPDSETPPGHWFVITNEVNDHELMERRYQGTGDPLDALEWDLKLYFSLGGAMHDAAITAWGIKGWYDYIRPVSAIRAMADLGQSSDSEAPSYNVNGIPLMDGRIELVVVGDPLAGDSDKHVDKIKLYTWRGPDHIENPAMDTAGVGWILAENWWPYQRPTFVTPPFAGYVSGHSTYSRAAAEVLGAFTGDEYFPGGRSTFEIPAGEFLVFESGPSVDITLEWARYIDASDQCSLSRIWGGIHPPVDDIPGRLIGRQIGLDAFTEADRHIQGIAN